MNTTTDPHGAKALANQRHEAFAMHYAGDCWGVAKDAYRNAGYRSATEHADAVAASRLLKRPDVAARVAHLRREAGEAMAVDRTWILERRRAIVEAQQQANPMAALKALDDLERALGLAKPARIEMEHSGAVANVHRLEVNPLAWEKLCEYVQDIKLTSQVSTALPATPSILATASIP